MKGESKNYKWLMLILISATYFLAQGTRQIYNAVLPQVKLDLAVDDVKLGLVGSVFTLTFGLVAPFAGFAADFFRRKWMVVIGAAVFSLGVFLSGYATGIGFLLVSYGIVTALGQSLMPPSNSSLISQYHVETRGTAFSVYQTAIYLGIVVFTLIAGSFAALGAGGWRLAFKVAGVFGLVWIALVAFFLHDTPQPVAAGATDKASVPEALKAFFGKPSAVLLMLALGSYFFATYGFKTWAPTYFTRMFPDMPQATVKFHSVIWFYIGAFLGVMLGGRVSDRFMGRRAAIRFEVELVGVLLCIPFSILMVTSTSLLGLCAAVGFFGFATGVYDSNLYAALMDIVSPRYRAVAVGIFGLGGCCVGALGPGVMGYLNGISPQVSFGSISVSCVLAAIFLVVIRCVTFKRDRI